MAYKRKYRKGARIESLAPLAEQEFIYCHDKILNRGWFQAWQIGYAKRMLERGALFYAVKEDNNEI